MSFKTICTQQRSRLKSILEGENSYGDLVGLWRFFCDIFQSCCELETAKNDEENRYENGYYVAFLTRRCHVLLQIFWDAVTAFKDVPEEEWPECLHGQDLSKWETIFKEHVITDIALVAMSGELARCHIGPEKRPFPRLIIVDEMTIHGRTLNNLLYKIENIVQTVCQRSGLSTDETKEAQDSLLCALELRIYMKNERSNLLLKRYAQRQNDKEMSIQPPSSWRRFSAQCTDLISHYPVNNVAFSWGLRSTAIPVGSFPAENSSSDFRRITTCLQETLEENYIWLYPNASHPKAVCAVRTKFCECQEDSPEGSRLTVPFIAYDCVSFDALCRLHERILEDIERDLESEVFQPVKEFLSCYKKQLGDDQTFGNAVTYRWISETNDLVLNALLMKKFQKVFPFVKEDIVCYEQLVGNYKYFSPEEDAGAVSRSVRDALEAIWSWEPEDLEARLRQYLDLLLDQAPSLDGEAVFGDPQGRLADMNDPQEQEAVVQGVEDAIAEIAFAAERNAYERYSSSIDYSDGNLTGWGEQYSLSALLPKCRQYLEENLKELQLHAELYQVIAVMIHAVDHGLMGMDVVRMQPSREDPERSVPTTEYYFTELRAGEASMFILPRRYKVFLPVLADIQSWRGKRLGNARREILHFLRKLLREARRGRASFPSVGWIEETGLFSLFTKLSRLFFLMVWTGQQYIDWNFLFNEKDDPEMVKQARQYLNIYQN